MTVASDTCDLSPRRKLGTFFISCGAVRINAECLSSAGNLIEGCDIDSLRLVGARGIEPQSDGINGRCACESDWRGITNRATRRRQRGALYGRIRLCQACDS